MQLEIKENWGKILELMTELLKLMPIKDDEKAMGLIMTIQKYLPVQGSARKTTVKSTHEIIMLRGTLAILHSISKEIIKNWSEGK